MEMEVHWVKLIAVSVYPMVVGCSVVGGYPGAGMAVNNPVVGALLGASIPISLGGLCFSPSMISRQIRWVFQSRHVAVTEDGIRFVQDKRQTCCGLRSKSSETVAFGQITDCDVLEAKGLGSPRAVVILFVTTPGSVASLCVLRLTGLKEPYKFSRLVWALKRSKMSGQGASMAYLAPTNANMHPERGNPQ